MVSAAADAAMKGAGILMAKFAMNQMTGVVPAMLSLFDENENVDVQRTRALTEFLIGRGVNGLYLTGSTGEGFMMDHDERKLVVETVIDQVAGRIPTIVHIGDIGTKKSIQLAKHAEAAGADAISSVPPFYWKFSNDDIFNYYKDISEATSLPMVIYSVPLAGSMGMDLIKRIAQLPNVKGLKFTSREHDQMGCLKADLGEDFIIYSGCDEMAMSGLAVGALVGILLNAVLPGNDYEFGQDLLGDTAVNFQQGTERPTDKSKKKKS
jgi:N-acetylneuraminate lyase